jgi:hypothetical protein
LVTFMRTLDTGQVGGALSEFMQFARENGPLVGDALMSLGKALTNLLVAAADTGVGMLTLITAFAGLVAAVPPEILTRLLQLALAFKAVRMAAAGMAAVGAAMAVVRTQIAAAGTAAVGATTRMGMLTLAFGALSRGAKIAVAGTGIGLLVIALMELSKIGKSTPPDVDKLTTALGELGRTGKVTGSALDEFGADFGKLRDQINAVINPSVAESINNWGADISGGLLDAGEATEKFEASMGSIDQVLADLVSGGKADLAKAALENMLASMNSEQVDKLKGSLTEYDKAVANLKFEQDLVAQSMGLFGEQAQAVQGNLAAQQRSADGLTQSINALSNAYLQARGGIRGMEAAIDAATEALANNGATLDNNTAAGRANNEALDNLATATIKAAESARANGSSWETVNGIYDRGRQKLIESADAMGLTREQAVILADQILRTPDKTARLKGNMEDLQRKLDDAKNQLKRVPDSRKARVRADIYQLEQAIAAARRKLDAINGKTSHTYVITHMEARREGSYGTELGYAHGGVIGAAGGGPRSRLTLVGEQGPELIDLAPGSRVRSNPDTKRMLAGGHAGGGGQPIVVQLQLEGRQVAEVLIDPLRGVIQGKGGNVQAVLGQPGR